MAIKVPQNEKIFLKEERMEGEKDSVVLSVEEERIEEA